jgi:hypothetical protein
VGRAAVSGGVMAVWAAILVTVVVAVGFAVGLAGVYDGLNKGVTVGDCGLELVGEPGPFCGNG